MRDTQLIEFEHNRVNLLLPWWINGTLGKREQQLVEKHVDSCALCQRESEVLRRCLNEKTAEPETLPNVNHALASVLQRIDCYEKEGQSSVLDSEVECQYGVADSVSGSLVTDTVADVASRQWPRAKLTSTLSMAAAAILLFAVMAMLRTTPAPVPGDGQYQVLSSSTPSADDLYLEVRFRDQWAARDGVAHLQVSLNDPDMITGWEKTDDLTMLFRIAATASPETLSQLLKRLGASDVVNKAALVLH